jgi:hypothetical protein
MGVTAAFERQKWPKVHEHLVEECLRAGQAMHVFGRPTEVPPGLATVHVRAGFYRRAFFLCPRCGQPCRSLYVPPGAPRDAWGCRRCHGLIYATQRFKTLRHPLRRVVLPHLRAAKQRTVARQERRAADARARWMGGR